MTIGVLLSGGLDSACALAVTAATRAFTFDYGQRHGRELRAAASVAAYFGIDFDIIPLTGLLPGESALTGTGAVPHGRYDAPSMAATVVPGRNLMMAAAAIARLSDGDMLAAGVHAGDHPVYPDCRAEFWAPFAIAAESAYGVRILTPFLNATKADVLQAGVRAGAPVEMTWSCYEGGDTHCGRCGTCVERAEAFAHAGITDPTTYADPDYWRQATCLT